MTSKIKLEYFPIAGVAEKVRLAFALSNTPFDDVRIDPRTEWPARKATAKYGQLPILTLPNGEEVYQSEAMLRWAGSLGDGSLYPTDLMARLKIDEIIALCGDLDRAWRPCMYIARYPEKFGHAGIEDSAKDAMIKTLREKFLAEDFPQFAGYFTDLLEKSGGPFLIGQTITIADLQAWNQLVYFTKGIADHIPKDCFAQYPVVAAYLESVQNHPGVKAYYESKA